MYTPTCTVAVFSKKFLQAGESVNMSSSGTSTSPIRGKVLYARPKQQYKR